MKNRQFWCYLRIEQPEHFMTEFIYNARFLLLIIFITTGPLTATSQKAVLENQLYKITLRKDGSFDLLARGQSTAYRFCPVFTLLYRADDPRLKNAGERSIAFRVPAWQLPGSEEFTKDLFKVATPVQWKAKSVSEKEGKISWRFPAHEGALLEAELILPAGREDPLLRYSLRVAEAGWYSVGYTGAPAIDPRDINELLHPNAQSHLIPENPSVRQSGARYGYSRYCYR